MSARRRGSGPVYLDAIALDGSDVPDNREQRAAEGYAGILEIVLAPVSVLGMRGRFPDVDGASQRTESTEIENSRGVRVVDVRGAQRGES